MPFSHFPFNSFLQGALVIKKKTCFSLPHTFGFMFSEIALSGFPTLYQFGSKVNRRDSGEIYLGISDSIRNSYVWL